MISLLPSSVPDLKLDCSVIKVDRLSQKRSWREGEGGRERREREREGGRERERRERAGGRERRVCSN